MIFLELIYLLSAEYHRWQVKKHICISMSCIESSPMQFFTMNGPGKAKERGNCVDNKPCVSYITYRNIHVISTYRKLALKSDLEKVNKAWTFSASHNEESTASNKIIRWQARNKRQCTFCILQNSLPQDIVDTEYVVECRKY